MKYLTFFLHFHLFFDLAAYIEAVCDLAEKQELRAMEQKAMEMESVKQTLLEQMNVPKNNAIKMDGPIIMERCGAASVQNFHGEDLDFEKRRKIQQKQV